MFRDAVKLHQPDPAVLADLPDTPAKPLFPPEVAQKARMLKKLWAIATLDLQWREEQIKIIGRHAVVAREAYSDGVESWFRMLK